MKLRNAIKIGIKIARVNGIKKGIRAARDIYYWADKARW